MTTFRPGDRIYNLRKDAYGTVRRVETTRGGSMVWYQVDGKPAIAGPSYGNGCAYVTADGHGEIEHAFEGAAA